MLYRFIAALLCLLVAQPSFAVDRMRVHLSTSVALTTTKTCFAVGLTDSTTADTTGVKVAKSTRLDRLEGNLTSIVTAATVDWYISRSLDGEKRITNTVQETIADDDSDGEDTINTLINSGYVQDASSTPGLLYVCALLNAGTATVVVKLTAEVAQ